MQLVLFAQECDLGKHSFHLHGQDRQVWTLEPHIVDGCSQTSVYFVLKTSMKSSSRQKQWGEVVLTLEVPGDSGNVPNKSICVTVCDSGWPRTSSATSSIPAKAD